MQMARLRSIVVGLVVMCSVAIGCAGSSDSSASKGEAADSSTQADSQGTPDPQLTPRPAPPPGTVEVRAVVEKCREAGGALQCEITVEAVLRYGSATPTVVPGLRMVAVPPEALPEQSAEALIGQGSMSFRLAAPPERMNTATESADLWTLVSVLD